MASWCKLCKVDDIDWHWRFTWYWSYSTINELDVEGGGAFSGNVSVGNNLTVGGALLGNVQGTLTGNVAGTLDGNSNATVGISTLNNLTISWCYCR